MKILLIIDECILNILLSILMLKFFFIFVKGNINFFLMESFCFDFILWFFKKNVINFNKLNYLINGISIYVEIN